VSAYLWVAVGSALGGMARYGCADLVARWLGQQFPWGTLLVNILGSFVIGWFVGLVGAGATDDPRLAVFVMVGICGGYTTFSALSLQTLVLTQKGAGRRAAAYVVASVALCALAVWLGLALGLGAA
jgi:fluoride exporter